MGSKTGFCLTELTFLVLVVLTPYNSLLHPLPKVKCANFLDFGNPWGGKMKRSGLRFKNSDLKTFSHKKASFALLAGLF